MDMLLILQDIQKKKYAEDETYAKSNKLGIWMMKFEYPWVWRKKNK